MYERARPGYPSDLVAELARGAGLGAGRTVLDLAAGTGKLTRRLADTGASVVAVEPVAAMRQLLAAAVPTATVLDGTAEAIPWPDGSVDLVTVAQAFHWFDRSAALAEIARVLRPGGSVALVWNTRDRRVPWVSAWDDLLRAATPSQPFDAYWRTDWQAVLAAAAGFTDAGRWDTTWMQDMDEDLLVARTASVSVVATLAPPAQAALFDRVRALVTTHPDLAGRPSFGFPYVTTLFRARRA